ncbi:MAG: hypothetical protein ABSH50_05995 [Bryobacteraceae bacterium]
MCQSYEFTPASGNVLSYFGSFNLQVWPAATEDLSPTGGPPGTEITTTGSGFAPSDPVAIYVDRIGRTPLVTVTAGPTGAFTIGAREPLLPYGPIDLYAMGLTSGKLGAAQFFVTAAIDMIPHTGAPGANLTAHGVGFGAGETVDIYWDDPRQLLGASAANAQGAATLTITIPADAPRGPNAVLGVGQATKATGSPKSLSISSALYSCRIATTGSNPAAIRAGM